MSRYTHRHNQDIRDKVCALRASGAYLSEIMAKTGLTKGQVSGIIWRDVKHKMPEHKPPRPQPPRKLKKTPNRRGKLPAIKPTPFIPKEYHHPVPVHMSRLKSFMCTEIIGEPENLLCCGERISRGSFCEAHAIINYRPCDVTQRNQSRNVL